MREVTRTLNAIASPDGTRITKTRSARYIGTCDDCGDYVTHPQPFRVVAYKMLDHHKRYDCAVVAQHHHQHTKGEPQVARSLKDQLMNPAEQWRPENEGDYVLGELESIEARNSKYGRFFLATLIVDEGTMAGAPLTKGTPYSVAFVGAALKARAASMGFRVGGDPNGAKLGVTYIGEQDSDKGNPTKVYNTVLRGSIKGGIALADVADDDVTEGEEPF